MLLLLLCQGCAFSGTDLVALSPGDDCASIVAASPKGSTFVFAPGLYREQQVIPRSGDSFVGDSASPGAVVLTGARVIDAAEIERHGTLCVAANRTEQPGQVHGECDAAHPRCSYGSDLFVTHAPGAWPLPLLHVNSSADVNASGTWFFDYEQREIVFGCASMPPGAELTLSVAVHAFATAYGAPLADNVSVSNMTVAQYSAPAQTGAIGGQTPGQGWDVSNVVATLNHGAGCKVRGRARVTDSRFLRNGQQGVTSTGDVGVHGAGVLLQGCELAFNNYAGFATGWEAGAGKFTATEGTALRDNFVHHNAGRGLWADIGGHAMVYADNVIVNNSLAGIAHEISYAAVVANNTLCFNGGANDAWLWGAQILIQNSGSVVVTNNTAVVGATAGGNGIGLIFQNRGNGTLGPRVTTNNTLTSNKLLVLGGEARGVRRAAGDGRKAWARATASHGITGGVSDCNGTAGVSSAAMYSNTTFDRNTYYYDDESLHLFTWGGRALDFAGWQTAGNDLNGKMMPREAGQVPKACFSTNNA